MQIYFENSQIKIENMRNFFNVIVLQCTKKNVKVIKSNIIIKRLGNYFESLGLNKKLDGIKPILTGLFYRFKNDI